MSDRHGGEDAPTTQPDAPHARGQAAIEQHRGVPEPRPAAPAPLTGREQAEAIMKAAFSRIASAQTLHGEIQELLTQARDRQVWVDLGYASWELCVAAYAAEYKISYRREVRQERLAEEIQTNGENTNISVMAAFFGTSTSTIHRDREDLERQGRISRPATTLGRDGRRHPSRKGRKLTPAPSAPLAKPAPVTAITGKVIERPGELSLAMMCRGHLTDLAMAVEGLHSITQQQQYPAELDTIRSMSSEPLRRAQAVIAEILDDFRYDEGR